uniref:coiled-coil domain-containing protein 181 isoform X2 n=1 Tax=Myxine glutinosa TaxID=7769 RepID=UPI00358FBB17
MEARRVVVTRAKDVRLERRQNEESIVDEYPDEFEEESEDSEGDDEAVIDKELRCQDADDEKEEEEKGDEVKNLKSQQTVLKEKKSERKTAMDVMEEQGHVDTRVAWKSYEVKVIERDEVLELHNGIDKRLVSGCRKEDDEGKIWNNKEKEEENGKELREGSAAQNETENRTNKRERCMCHRKSKVNCCPFIFKSDLDNLIVSQTHVDARDKSYEEVPMRLVEDRVAGLEILSRPKGLRNRKTLANTDEIKDPVVSSMNVVLERVGKFERVSLGDLRRQGSNRGGFCNERSTFEVLNGELICKHTPLQPRPCTAGGAVGIRNPQTTTQLHTQSACSGGLPRPLSSCRPGSMHKKQRHPCEEEEELSREGEAYLISRETAFHTWLQQKRLQMVQERKLQEAKRRVEEEMKVGDVNEVMPRKEIFHEWLRGKNKERKMQREAALKVEEEKVLRDPEENHRAYREWLHRKAIERRMAREAFRQRIRVWAVESRRAKRDQDLFNAFSKVPVFRH